MIIELKQVICQEEFGFAAFNVRDFTESFVICSFDLIYAVIQLVKLITS